MKPWKHCLAVMAALVGLVLPGVSLAQNPGNGGANFDGMQVTTRPEDFLGKFVELAQADAAAHATLLIALGDGEGAAKLRAPLALLDVNATPSQIGAASDAIRAARQGVAALLATPVQLSATNQSNFADGALRLARAAHEFTLLTKNIHVTKQSLAMAGSPARIALYAARATPDINAQIHTELGAILAFAGTRQLSLAPEVGVAAAEL
jgi:hypothetical protein